MKDERPGFQLWSEGGWRCEWWTVDGKPQVRLYLDAYLVSELTAGPRLDLERQADFWHANAVANATNLPVPR